MLSTWVSVLLKKWVYRELCVKRLVQLSDVCVWGCVCVCVFCGRHTGAFLWCTVGAQEVVCGIPAALSRVYSIQNELTAT